MLAKNPHQQVVRLQTKEKPVDFFMGINFSSRNNFANLGSVAYASVPV